MTTVAVEPARAPGGGWRIVARKEIADHVRSVRFAVLLVIVAVAGLAAVHSASDAIRGAAQQAAGAPSLFLFLFTTSPERVPAFYEFVGFLGPLLGIAFGFDAFGAERSQRTLPRVVSHPIHRDDVVNGKFVAAGSLVAVSLVAVIALVSGYGILRLGLFPTGEDILRLAIFAGLSIVYVSVWLAFALLVSALTRRTATAVLVTVGVWVLLTFFAGLISGIVADTVHPVDDASSVEEVLANARLDQNLHRLSPEQLYSEATGVLLDPAARATTTLVDVRRLDQALPTLLPLGESVALAWWQVMVLLAEALVAFAGAYWIFLRQELRA